jgi:hypothetical protein
MNFFITGLPRSRTAWFANLFTTGSVFCWHDALKEGPLDITLSKARVLMPSVLYFGNSDSAVPLAAREIYKAFPEAKWVFVRRDFDDAYDSFCKEFADLLPGHEIKKNFSKIMEGLQIARLTIPEENQICIDYDALDNEKIIREVWEFCLPSVRFSTERWKLLDTFRVNVIAKKAYSERLLKGNR